MAAPGSSGGGCAPRIVSLNPSSLDDVLADALTVGEALGLQQQAAAAVVALRGRVAAVQAHVAQLSAAPGFVPPSVAFLEWIEPLFPAGHWCASAGLLHSAAVQLARVHAVLFLGQGLGGVGGSWRA